MHARLSRFAPVIALGAIAALVNSSGAQQCTGMAEVMGNDMTVSLARSDISVSFYTHGPALYAVWNESGTAPVPHTAGHDKYDLIVAGTFMHELGHNLGLCHDGPVLDASGSEVLYLTSDNGHLYKLDAYTGAALASVDTRRAICPDDQITAPPAVQLYSKSNAAFQSAMVAERGHPDDLVFVVTHHGCGDGTGNQVLAYYGSDLTPKWLFNSSGTYSMDYSSDGCEVDYTRNQVYCGTHEGALGQSTVWALQTVPTGSTGSLVWSYGAGSIKNRPIIKTGELYLVRASDIQRLDPSNGSILWTLPTGSAVVRNVWPEYRSPLPTRIYYTTDDGLLHGVLENFPSPVPLWPPVSPPGGGKFTTIPALALGTGKLYLGRNDGSIEQVSADTGALECSAPSGTPGTLWDPSPDFSSATAQSNDRLDVTTTEGSIHRYSIPWGSTTAVAPSSASESFALERSAPNPFSTNTRIEYRLPSESRVEVEIFAIDGRRVRRLVGERQPAGAHDAAWDGRDDAGRAVTSGPYFFRMRMVGPDGRTTESSEKVVLVR